MNNYIKQKPMGVITYPWPITISKRVNELISDTMIKLPLLKFRFRRSGQVINLHMSRLVSFHGKLKIVTLCHPQPLVLGTSPSDMIWYMLCYDTWYDAVMWHDADLHIDINVDTGIDMLWYDMI